MGVNWHIWRLSLLTHTVFVVFLINNSMSLTHTLCRRRLPHVLFNSMPNVLPRLQCASLESWLTSCPRQS
jgi:hypothetical protein